MTQVFPYPSADGSARNLGSIRRLVPAAQRAGLVGEYLFGFSAAASVYNLALPPATLAVVGAPAFEARDVTVDQADWFDTGLPDTANVTLVAISNAQGAATTNAWQITTFNNANGATTTSLDATGANGGQLRAIASGGLQLAGIHTPLTDFTVKALRVSVLTGTSFSIAASEYRAGAQINNVSTVVNTARVPDASATFAIGSPHGAGSAAAFKLGGAAIWSRALSDADLLAVAAAATPLFAGYGITV